MPAVSFLYYKRCVCVAVRQTEEFVQLNFTAPLCGLYVKRPLLFKRNVKTYRVCIFSASMYGYGLRRCIAVRYGLNIIVKAFPRIL